MSEAERKQVQHLEGTNMPSYVSTYRLNGEALGVLDARILYVTFQKHVERPVYYISYTSAKKDITLQLIRTAYYQIRRLEPTVKVMLFESEKQDDGLVPLVTCLCETFIIPPYRPFLHASTTLIEITCDKISLLMDLVKAQRVRFDCTILTDISYLMRAIKNEEIVIYGILYNDRLETAYAFRNDQELIASIYNAAPLELFQFGFEQACHRVRKRSQTNSVLVYRLGDSMAFINIVNPEPAHYRTIYLYNYVIPVINCNKCFFLY
jgi:hypothetical protein